MLEGQKKPRARLEAENCPEAFQGKARDGGDRHSAEGTLAFLVAQSHSQIHRGVARIRLHRQVSAASCKQAVELRAQPPCRGSIPSGSGTGCGDPQKLPVLAEQPHRDRGGAAPSLPEQRAEAKGQARIVPVT